MDSSFSLTRSLKSFEREWESSPPASIDSHLEGASGNRRLTLLQELVCIDMEFRWRNHAASATQVTQSLGSDSTIPTFLIDDYLEKYPDLGTSETLDPLLVEEEFRVRSQWGDRPLVEDFLARFPAHAESMCERLPAIHADITGKLKSDSSEEHSVNVAEFLKRVANCGLHDAESLQHLNARLKAQGPFTNGRDVGNWLVNQKLLTQSQLEILLKGMGCPLVLGSYEILDEIGAGGMGQVYKARHREMNREVALKTLKSSLTATKESAQRFQREVEAAARLVHQNVVVAHDAGEANGVRYLVMELIEGQDLSSLIRESGPLPVTEAIDCILQAAEGLKYAHQRGVIHRDVKPGNLLLNNDGVVKVLDLGLARFNEPDIALADAEAEPLTSAGMVMGTADYMAPEQASETRTADERSDIYSLGCTLHFLLTGKRVFPAKTLWQTLSSHVEKPIPSLHDARADVTPELDDIFQRMLAKKAGERFQSMQEVIDALAGSEPAADPGSVDLRPPAGLAADFTVESAAVTGNASATDETILLPESRSVRTSKRWLPIAAAIVILAIVGFSLWQRSHSSIAPDGLARTGVLNDSTPSTSTDASTTASAESLADTSPLATKNREDAVNAVWLEEDPKLREQLRKVVQGLPSPLDALSPQDIPTDIFQAAIQYDRTGFLEDHLVAVLGNSEMVHWNKIRAVAFTNDSKRVITGSQDGTVVVRDAVNGRVLKRLELDGYAGTLAVSPDDKQLYVGDSVAIEEWDLTTYQRNWRKTDHGHISSLACSGNGRWLAVGGYDTGIHLLDRNSNEWKTHSLRSACTSMTFCGDDHWLAMAQGITQPGVAIFDLESRSFAGPLDTEICNSIAASADGSKLFVNDVKQISTWDVADWSLTDTFESATALSTAIHPDGNTLALIRDVADRQSGGVALVDARSGTTIGDADAPIFEEVWSVEFSADGTRLAAGCSDGLYLWHTSTWRRVTRTEPDDHGAIEKLALHTNARLLAAATSLRTIDQWDLSTGESLSTTRLETSTGLPAKIEDLDFSPDGTRLAVAGYFEKALRYLVPQTGETKRHFPMSEAILRLAFSPDGSRLYTTHWNGSCVERDAVSAEALRTFQITEGAVRGLRSRP
jgi:serine/threonine-protein kinase